MSSRNAIAKAKQKQIRAYNAKEPARLRAVPREEWPLIVALAKNAPIAVFRSRDFLLQVYQAEGATRLSICRTAMGSSAEGWMSEDGITWDQLQCLKREAGYGDQFAVEIYPSDADVVNVANMRHLWVLDNPLAFAWSAKSEASA